MKKNKSKSHILKYDKQSQNFAASTKTNKNRDVLVHKSNSKLTHNSKSIQKKSNSPQKTASMHIKAKSYLEKMTINLIQQSVKNQISKYNRTQRRKSASIVSQRAQSRTSKRSSVVSTKSNKDKKTQSLKDNTKNNLNLYQVQENENQQMQTDIKKVTKKLQNKKKLLLNLNLQPKIQIRTLQPQKKKGQKSENYHAFQQKMSQYVDSKDIFSRKVSRQNLNHTKSNKKSNSKKKSSDQKNKEIQQKSSGQLKNKERQNLLEIYQFYKKTFDINFNNCFKKGKNMTKIDKNPELSSKSQLRPFYSSVGVDRKQVTMNQTDEKNTLLKINNQNKISIEGSFVETDEFLRSKRSGSTSILKRQNETKLTLQKSPLIHSRSKSRNSNANSDSLTRDNVVYWKADQQNIDTNRLDQKKSKKTIKELITFNEKYYQGSDNKNNPSNDLRLTKLNQEQNKFRKIEIGQSNLQVLKWSQNRQNSMENYEQVIEPQKNIYKAKQLQKMKSILPHQINNLIEQKNIPQIQSKQQQLDVTKLIKRKSKQEQIESLNELSSISLVYEQKDNSNQNLFSNSFPKGPIMLEIDDADFLS